MHFILYNYSTYILLLSKPFSLLLDCYVYTLTH